MLAFDRRLRSLLLRLESRLSGRRMRQLFEQIRVWAMPLVDPSAEAVATFVHDLMEEGDWCLDVISAVEEERTRSECTVQGEMSGRTGVAGTTWGWVASA